MKLKVTCLRVTLPDKQASMHAPQFGAQSSCYMVTSIIYIYKYNRACKKNILKKVYL